MTGVYVLVFDFDGLIMDTETPEFQAWQEIYQDHGATLELDEWIECIGSSFERFNPYTRLEERTGREINRAALDTRRRARTFELLSNYRALPGVEQYIADAKQFGLKLAIASSSSRDWVVRNLRRLGIEDAFSAISTRDQASAVKPDPEIFLNAAEMLGVQPEQCVVFEDSPNGIKAAKAAGMVAVAVPNDMTARFDLSEADFRLGSLADMPLKALLERVKRREAPPVGA